MLFPFLSVGLAPSHPSTLKLPSQKTNKKNPTSLTTVSTIRFLPANVISLSSSVLNHIYITVQNYFVNMFVYLSVPGSSI